MATQVIEGTWEEIARHANKFIGHKVRVTILDDEALPIPNQRMLDIINKVAENQKDRKETDGETSVEIIRRGRAGEMFNNDSSE